MSFDPADVMDLLTDRQRAAIVADPGCCLRGIDPVVWPNGEQSPGEWSVHVPVWDDHDETWRPGPHRLARVRRRKSAETLALQLGCFIEERGGA